MREISWLTNRFTHVDPSDLLSFYKEACEGETENYICQLAASKGISHVEALEEVKNTVVDLDQCIREILGDSPERDGWEAFRIGYVDLHLYNERYRLSDILSEFC